MKNQLDSNTSSHNGGDYTTPEASQASALAAIAAATSFAKCSVTPLTFEQHSPPPTPEMHSRLFKGYPIRIAIKEGIPSLLVEEAELPPGCQSLQDLPCQEAARTVGTTS